MRQKKLKNLLRKSGYAFFEKEVVDAEKFILPEISSTLGELEKAYDECGLPLKYCTCGKFSFLERETEEEKDEEEFKFNF